MRSGSATVLAVAILIAGCGKPRPAVPVPALPPLSPVQQLQSDIDNLIDQPGHLHGLWGVAIHSVERNERLYERNPRTLLVPASTTKLVTVAAAADAVGWDYRFETVVLGTGRIEHGTLKGDLVIVGNGDPSVLGRPDGDTFDLWLDALRNRGITRIEGRIVGDDDRGEEPAPGFAWSWEDLAYTYGAIPGALNLGENTLEVTVSPGHAEGLPTIVEVPDVARGLPLINQSRTGAPGTPVNLWAELRPGEATMSIHGTIAAATAPAVLTVSAGNPTEWFARVVRNGLLAAGIDVTGQAVDVDHLVVKPILHGAEVLHVHRSMPLADIAKPLVKDSVNLYAEALLRLVPGHEDVRTRDAGLDAVRATLEAWGIPKEGIQIVDGSGLSRRNVMAPDTLIALLQRFHDESGTSPFMQMLAVAGRDGTLSKRMTGTAAEGNAAGKTGTMSNVRALAGYVQTADGEPLAFAIIANNFEGPGAGVTATIDRLVARLASFSRAVTVTATP